jgi:SAM-dependent methyltransferase
VARVYGDDYFRGGGAGYPDYLAEERLLVEHGRRYGRLLARHTVPGVVLDVGAAAGFILQGLVESGWQGMGVEPNAAMAAHARSRGLDVRAGSLETLEVALRFDLVSWIQVVAHLVDPRAAFLKAAALTRPGGYWLLETWDRESLAARAAGRRWHEYCPPSVLHWFTREGLRRLGADCGMREVARGRPAKWIESGHAVSLLRHKLAPHPGGRWAGAALRAVPRGLRFPYPGDDIFWMLLRKEGA